MQIKLKKTIYGGLTAIIFALVLSACSAGTLVTPTVIPTIAIPSTAGPTEVISMPTSTEDSSQVAQLTTELPMVNVETPIVVEQPTLQVAVTSAPLQQGSKFPPALLQIVKPGEMSRLSSPILVTANVYPGEGGMVNVQLIGEDGRVMADQLLQLTNKGSGWVSLATEIQFEINSAGESALVVVSTRDAYGLRMAQVAVPVILLQVGNSEIENPGFDKQPVILDTPVMGGFVRKGSLHIEGLVHSFNENAIIVELFTQTGGIVANKAVYVTASEGSDFVPFALDLPYAVTKRTPVRLTIRQASEISSAADIFLYSQLIFLDP